MNSRRACFRFQGMTYKGPSYAQGVAIQPDGRIVVVGEFNDDFAIARYLGAPTG